MKITVFNDFSFNQIHVQIEPEEKQLQLLETAFHKSTIHNELQNIAHSYAHLNNFNTVELLLDKKLLKLVYQGVVSSAATSIVQKIARLLEKHKIIIENQRDAFCKASECYHPSFVNFTLTATEKGITVEHPDQAGNSVQQLVLYKESPAAGKSALQQHSLVKAPTGTARAASELTNNKKEKISCVIM